MAKRPEPKPKDEVTTDEAPTGEQLPAPDDQAPPIEEVKGDDAAADDQPPDDSTDADEDPVKALEPPDEAVKEVPKHEAVGILRQRYQSLLEQVRLADTEHKRLHDRIQAEVKRKMKLAAADLDDLRKQKHQAHLDLEAAERFEAEQVEAMTHLTESA